MIARATDLFPLWAVLLSAIAYLAPEPFVPLRPAIVPLLGVIMFGMGIGLSGREFLAVGRRPGMVALGLALQFGWMPMAAFLVGRGLGLAPELVAGMVVVGSCPGGTASNVICYLARADLALSITLTTVSTLVSIVATPLLVAFWVGREVEVDVLSMIGSIVRVVLLPVALGVLANRLAGARLAGAKQVFPLVSVLAIVAIIAIVVALSRDRIADLGPGVAWAVVLHNALGLAGGYLVPRLVGAPARVCRTLAIEVGMQNSGLGVALALRYLDAAAALPGALFSIWHNLSGSLLAAFWRRNAPDDTSGPTGSGGRS